jgi:O-antigen ligase
MLARAPALRSHLDALAATALGLATVGLTAANQGGYFAPAWGWTGLGLLLAVALALAFRTQLEIGLLEAGLVAGLAAILLWIAASVAWSASRPRTVEELERTLVYVGAAAAAIGVVRLQRLPYLLGGLLAAIVAVSAYSLAAPADSPLTDALIGPVGYWNALGILVSIGIILAIGFATSDFRRVIRLGALAAIPVLGTTLYLTKSRGAFGALVGGLFTLAFLHPLLRPRRARLAAAAVLVLVLVALAIGIIRTGGPGALLGKTYSAFRGPAAPGGRPNESFLTFSSNNRSEYWRVALRDYRMHPWLGSGAGTFQLYWNRYRHTIYGARDAHSLYVETLAELGPVGLALVVATLALPFLGLRRTRRDALLAAAAAAYTAFVVHVGIDWDWEVPAVMLTGIFCGAAILIGAPATRRGVLGHSRWGALGAVGILAVFATVALRGNLAQADSIKAAERGDYDAAAGTARTAARWMPWSSEPWRLRGEAQLALGDAQRARTSFREGIEQDPRDWKLWYDLARASRGAVRDAAIEEAAQLNRYSLEVLAFRRR